MPEPDTLPRLEWRGEGTARRLQLVTATGEKWRVIDVHFWKGRDRRLPLGDARANYRYFTNAEGVRRLKQLREPRDHALDVETVAEQLRGAGYAPREPFDPKGRDPERR